MLTVMHFQGLKRSGQQVLCVQDVQSSDNEKSDESLLRLFRVMPNLCIIDYYGRVRLFFFCHFYAIYSSAFISAHWRTRGFVAWV